MLFIEKIVWLVIITFIPSFESRLSIPIGLYAGTTTLPIFGETTGFGLDPLTVFVVVVVANIILGPIAYFSYGWIIKTFTKIKPIGNLYHWFSGHVESKRHLVKKYGIYAIIFFVAMPLPGSGSWGGAFSARILKIDFKEFMIANIIGVIIAAILVMAIFLGLFSFFGIAVA